MKRSTALLILWLGACRQLPEPVLHDLSRCALSAESASRRQLVLFGTAAAEPFQAGGLMAAVGVPADDPHALCRRRARVAFRFTDVHARVALLDLAPLPGLAAQALEVSLNQTRLARLEAAAERRRYVVPLPPAAQREGRNIIELLFDQVTERQTAFRLKLAARLYAVAISTPDDPAVSDVLRPEAPPLLSAPPPPARPGVRQTGAGALYFTLVTPERSTLRFTPEALLAPAHYRVTAQEETGVERELWRGDARPGSPSAEAAVPLPGARLLRLGLHLDGAAAVWQAPRIVGPGPAGPLLTEAPTAVQAASPPPARVRNLVFVILDAAGARHFGSYGYARDTTPQIDRLAREGVLFEQAYSPAGYTLLAMASTWTSLFPDQHHNGVPPGSQLPRDLVTLCEVLGASGIASAGFVGNAMAGTAFGLDRGFGEFEEVYRKHGAGAQAFRPLVPEWLQAHRDRRFFAYVHFREPHFPYDPPAPFDTRFGPDAPLPRATRNDPGWLKDVNWTGTLNEAQRAHLERLYDGNLAYVDQQFGLLRHDLEQAGLWDQTAVIVAADHGEALGEHGFVGHEQQIYEDIAHIPLVLRLPGGPAGVRVRGFVDLLDIAPTVTELLGLGPARGFLGTSLLGRLAGAPGKPFVVARTPGVPPRYALRHERFNFYDNLLRGTPELYDRDADPGERQDLSVRLPLRVRLYRERLHRLILEFRRGSLSSGAATQLTPEQREELKALGYLN